MRRVFTIALCLAMSGTPLHAVPQIDVPQGSAMRLGEAVEVATMSKEDIRFLQFGLALSGDYAGQIDGIWGDLTEEALEGYTQREFNRSPVTAHLASVAGLGLEAIRDEGWKLHYDTWLQLGYAFPFGAFKPGPDQDGFVHWQHARSSLRMSMTRTPLGGAIRLHQYAIASHASTREPYKLRESTIVVTAVDQADGSRFYVRSELIDGAWSSVLASARPEDAGQLTAFTSSISANVTAGSLLPPEGSALHQTYMAVTEQMERDDRAEMRAISLEPEQSTPPTQARSSGTGIVVAENGLVLTNAHVVAGCTAPRVNGVAATVRHSSTELDLALLAVAPSAKLPVARFAIDPARLNEDITVLGFPLNGILGGLNVTRGAVSSALGLGGDVTNMQISAPVQPGNSGGPVVDAAGRVVGVVVSKFDAVRMADVSGDIPQNINFAIRAKIAKSYLEAQGITPSLDDAAEPLNPVDLAERAARFTTLVTC